MQDGQVASAAVDSDVADGGRGGGVGVQDTQTTNLLCFVLTESDISTRAALEMPDFVRAAKNQEWDNVMVRRPLEGRLAPPAHIGRAVGRRKVARVGMEQSAATRASPNPPPTPSRPFPFCNVPLPAPEFRARRHWVACRDCCVRAVRTSASETSAFPRQPVQTSDFFRCSLTRFPSDVAFPRVGAAARAVGGMPEYGEYPQVPQPPAV